MLSTCALSYVGLAAWVLASIPPAARAADLSSPVSSIRNALSIDAVEVPAAQSLPAFASTPVTSTQQSLRDTAAAAIVELYTHGNTDFVFNDIGWWQSANAYTATFDFDLYTAGKTFQASAGQDLLSLIAKGQPDGDKGLINVYNDDSLWWALACLDAYAAYGDATYLDNAVDIWTWVHSTSQITQTGVAPDMGGIQRTSVVSANCQMQMGVYWTTMTTETYVNSIATGLFMQVSARLYEIYHSAEYLTAGEGALNWLMEHTVDVKAEVVSTDGVNGTSCGVSAGAYTYNTGVFIGGLVSLFHGTGNGTYLSEAEVAGASAMETTLWTNGAGFITEDDNATANSDGVGFKSILLRDLMQLYLATASASLKQEITGFVNVNYNSLYNKARSGNDYGGDWSGPYAGKTTWGQFVAIDLLNAGMLVNGGAGAAKLKGRTHALVGVAYRA